MFLELGPFHVNVCSRSWEERELPVLPQLTRSNLDQKVSEQSLSAERSSPIRSITEHSFPLCCCVIVLALPLPDRCRTAGHLATLAKRLEGKHLGLSVAVDSLAECSHATSNTSPALQLLPKSRFRDKVLVFRDKTTMMMELSALADAASSIEFTDRECYDLLRTQWESSCDQIRLVPLSECSNYSVQCLRCAWQCKARSFYKKHHQDFCALRQFSVARDILINDTKLLSSLCFAKDGSWRSSFAGPQVMPLPVSCG